MPKGIGLYFMKRNNRVRDGIVWLLFLAYMCLLLYLVFFAEDMGRAEAASGYKYNLTPFQEIERYKKYLGHWDTIGKIAFMNIIGNILAFVPFGILFPELCEGKVGIIFTIVIGFSLSLVIECIQLITHVGCFDVDDLILNTSGVLVGYIVYLLVGAIRKKL